MDTTITESEADTLFTQSRMDNFVPQQPALHDGFLRFVELLSAVKPPPGQAILVFHRQPTAPPEMHILGESLTLGRRLDCTIPLPEIQTLSGLHFTISRTDSGFLLTDQSRNGTFLYPGTRRLPPNESYLLNDGDLLWVEGIVLAFKAA